MEDFGDREISHSIQTVTSISSLSEPLPRTLQPQHFHSEANQTQTQVSSNAELLDLVNRLSAKLKAEKATNHRLSRECQERIEHLEAEKETNTKLVTQVSWLALSNFR